MWVALRKFSLKPFSVFLNRVNLPQASLIPWVTVGKNQGNLFIALTAELADLRKTWEADAFVNALKSIADLVDPLNTLKRLVDNINQQHEMRHN